ncbi:hypothetical protein A6R68_04343, partial [Neotoma lepida]
VAEIVVHIHNELLTGADGKNLSKDNLYPNLKPVVLHTIYTRALQIISDLLYPKAKRSIQFLSGIINFIHFKEACWETYAELLWENKSCMDKMQQLNCVHQEALMKLGKLNSVPAEEQEEFRQLLDNLQELQHLLNQEFRQNTTVLQKGIAQINQIFQKKTSV